MKYGSTYIVGFNCTARVDMAGASFQIDCIKYRNESRAVELIALIFVCNLFARRTLT